MQDLGLHGLRHVTVTLRRMRECIVAWLTFEPGLRFGGIEI